MHGGLAGGNRSAKEPGYRSVREIVDACDGGDENRSAVLCAQPGCAGTMPLLQYCSSVVGIAVVVVMLHDNNNNYHTTII